MPEQVPVTAERLVMAVADPLAATVALRDRLGPDQVFLLESAGGPDRDCRTHVIGFGTLVSVSVTAGEVRVDGVAPLYARVHDRIAPLLDGTTLRDEKLLWDLVRAVQGVFDAPESASSFEFGFLAFFGYDVARYIEDLPHLIEDTTGVPDLHLVLHQGMLRTDIGADTELVLHRSPFWQDLDIDEIAAVVRAAELTREELTTSATVQDDTDRATFVDRVGKCLGHISIGDIYQVQIGHELSITSDADPIDVYRRLRERNASPYMFLAPMAGDTLVGASPELFVRVCDGEVVMRPIAGTIPRGAVDDEVAARRLSTDEKEIAEHVMLVDLCRNDIGRICAGDSLAVPEELVVERYSHVLHLVSTVVGRVAEGVDALDVVAALFPAGTMTGAPKVRAMEIIEETESSRRGMYAGAVGLLGHGGYLNLALCIRTLIHRDGVYRTRASAGVVADSQAGLEWTETLAKCAAAYWAVTGRELL